MTIGWSLLFLSLPSNSWHYNKEITLKYVFNNIFEHLSAIKNTDKYYFIKIYLLVTKSRL